MSRTPGHGQARPVFVPRRCSLPDGVIVERDTGETLDAFERRVNPLALAGSPQDLVVTVHSFDGDACAADLPAPASSASHVV